jgi:hypothetical protein
MLKIIGGVIVYGFALYGLTMYLKRPGVMFGSDAL